MKSILLGNGINIQFGGQAYNNRFIMLRLVFNALADKYDSMFNEMISGKDIVSMFKGLLPTANSILTGKYDSLGIEDPEIIASISEFKEQNKWRKHFENYYDVPIEDWLLLLRLFLIDNPDLDVEWVAAKQGFERIILDAIYNDGDIQDIHNKMDKKARRKIKHYLTSFDNIFTLNYDNNIEALTGRKVYHLHGEYSVPADSENPETVQGFLRSQSGTLVTIPGFEHCYCNALLNYSGSLKYKQAADLMKYNELLKEFTELNKSDTLMYELRKMNLVSQIPDFTQIIDTYIEHPELKGSTDYHFTDFENLSGELHIIGLAPQNDGHIFACIERSHIDKVYFYYFGNPPKNLPLKKSYEFKTVEELWESLDCTRKTYNCNRKLPASDKVDSFFKLFNNLSFDPISKEEAISEANSIPDFVAKPLCEKAVKLMESPKLSEPTKSEDEFFKRFRELSRIALREGILPTAFFLLLICFIGLNSRTDQAINHK